MQRKDSGEEAEHSDQDLDVLATATCENAPKSSSAFLEATTQDLAVPVTSALFFTFLPSRHLDGPRVRGTQRRPD